MRRSALAVPLSALIAFVGIGAATPAPAVAVTATSDVGTLATTPLAPGLSLSTTSTGGPNQINVLTANLSEPTLKPKYLNPGTVGATATLTSQANRVGAVAAVNGDFFDIGVTGAPRGIGLDDGTLLNGPASGWNNVAALYANGTGTRGGLAQIFLDAKIALPGGAQLTATNLNSPNIAADGIGVYNALWGDEPRSQVLDGATRSREVEVTGGRVSRVSTTAGAKVPAGSVAILGVNAGADALAGIAVGDPVTVNYSPRGGAGAAQVAIGGNLVLVRDGVATTVSHPRNPRTAVGFSADGLTMWMVVVDGRSSTSVGMTYVELANYMKSLGADDAINLDGGGSSTLVARMPGATSVSVRNTPSDGAQRAVPNGIGFVSTAQAWSSTVDNTTAGRFSASANWGTSSYSSQRFGADYRFADPVLSSDVAWYRVNVPETGSYAVSVWYPADPGYNDSTPFIVATTGGNQTVRVNQRANGGRWVSLGVFTLAAGDANTVGVSRWTSGTGYVVADAVRVTRV
ncbi:phosphodiester glycosidase family protein [Plantactinospora sp. KLBMP9567]|uniref:golvesin C-terminal-like domain-containing protein n=1 Tax=Plantactinospora sp. KLBMP9567 TaxID=3085900 RepID=UPI0029825CEB|nr:phosphodiester glycosidase family protein [Plantactinospora sp. KLBMP9567]MDW5324193.1 phosphodiester glycosidase family protein [Plantactinospora sp. KLBMP9567]